MNINIIGSNEFSKKPLPQMGKNVLSDVIDVFSTGKQLVSLIFTVLVKVAQFAFKFFSTLISRMANGMINPPGIKCVKLKSPTQVDTDQSRKEQNSAGSKNVSKDGLEVQFRQSVASDDMDEKSVEEVFNKHVMDEGTASGSRSLSDVANEFHEIMHAFEGNEPYYIPPQEGRIPPQEGRVF